MGATPSRVTTGIQQYPASNDRLFTALPCLPVDYYFPMVSAHKCSCHMPVYVEEVHKHFKEAYAEAHLQTNNEADRQKWYNDRVMSTMQLVPGNVVLLRSDAFQGKRKVKDRWSDSEYVVVQQVTDDVPVYEVKDDDGNIKVIHYNRLFLMATVSGGVTPLGASKSLSEENVTRSTLVELTPLEWENEVPESSLDEAATLCLTSHVPLGWVDGVLQPLPSVILRPTVRGLGAGDGVWSLSNEEVH